ncbi:hypothetical protein BDA96_01G319300 [Sorghum bicolor]|uniref:Uncharacterized protein n=1 Tax=Sorghum bicolor TaxID=4558 RepID=A0A921S227_SORBI|nr:hypothetical protein BDA96_01G319300 [Sorghum bicolor]
MTTGKDDRGAAVPRVVSILSRCCSGWRAQRRRRGGAGGGGAVVAAAAAAGRPVSAFQGLTKPAISIGGYLERIFRFASCSPSCYVVAYIYLDRFLRRRPALAVDSSTCYNNAYFARCGRHQPGEMNYLEWTSSSASPSTSTSRPPPSPPTAPCSRARWLPGHAARRPSSRRPAAPPLLRRAAAGTSDHHHDDPAAAAVVAGAAPGCHRHSQTQLTV